MAAPAQFDSPHGTHASFGRRGDRLVVTYHGDHAYSFDVTGAGSSATAYGAPPQPEGAQPEGPSASQCFARSARFNPSLDRLSD